MIVGIDIGSGSLRALGCVFEEGSRYPTVIAMHKKAMDGVTRGVVTDDEETARHIADAIQSLEEQSGHKTLHTLVSVGGAGLSSHHSSGHTQVSRGDASVTDLDVENAIKDATRGVPDVRNKAVVHSIPIKYRLDGNDVPGSILGVRGNRLEVKTLFVTYPLQCMSSLKLALEKAHVRVTDIVAGPIAESIPLLSKKQKLAGVALVNIGSQVTSLLVYENNNPTLVTTIPTGGDDFTKDIALGLKITLEEAEDIKCGRLSPQYHKRRVDEIIEARLEDLCVKINRELNRIGRQELLPAGILIFGPTSLLPNIDIVFRSELRLPVKVLTNELQKMSQDTIRDVSWARCYGLTFLAPADTERDVIRELVTTIFMRVKKFMHQFLP